VSIKDYGDVLFFIIVLHQKIDTNYRYHKIDL